LVVRDHMYSEIYIRVASEGHGHVAHHQSVSGFEFVGGGRIRAGAPLRCPLRGLRLTGDTRSRRPCLADKLVPVSGLFPAVLGVRITGMTMIIQIMVIRMRLRPFGARLQPARSSGSDLRAVLCHALRPSQFC
jgi:hypothetical protein